MGRQVGIVSGIICAVFIAGCAGLTPRVEVVNLDGARSGRITGHGGRAAITEYEIHPVIGSGTEMVVRATAASGAPEQVAWRDGYGAVRWRGRMQEDNGTLRAVLPVYEPLTSENTIEYGKLKVDFTVQNPMMVSPTPILVKGVTDTHQLEGWRGLVEALDPAVIHPSIAPFSAWILSWDVMDWDEPIVKDVKEMARGLFALRDSLRPEDYGVAVAIGDDVLCEKAKEALVLQAGVWPSEKGKAPILVAAKGETTSGESLTIEVDGEEDIERLAARIRELCPPPIGVSDDEGKPVSATVHAFRGGSAQVFLIDLSETHPPRVHLRSERGGFWCDVRRGVVLGNGKEVMIPGRAPEPFVIALLPYTVKKLDAKAKRVIDGGMLLDVAVVADGPITAPHIVEIYAADNADETVPGSIRVVRLKRGKVQRWYQWGEGAGQVGENQAPNAARAIPPESASTEGQSFQAPKKVVVRDVLTGFRAELSIAEPAPPRR